MEDLLDHLQEDYSFTHMNLTVGYHQVCMNETSHLGKWMVIYLDDILVFNNSWVEHLQHIHNILDIAWEHTLHVKKSYFVHTLFFSFGTHTGHNRGLIRSISGTGFGTMANALQFP
jgi:hypothetical protein